MNNSNSPKKDELSASDEPEAVVADAPDTDSSSSEEASSPDALSNGSEKESGEERQVGSEGGISPPTIPPEKNESSASDEPEAVVADAPDTDSSSSGEASSPDALSNGSEKESSEERQVGSEGGISPPTIPPGRSSADRGGKSGLRLLVGTLIAVILVAGITVSAGLYLIDQRVRAEWQALATRFSEFENRTGETGSGHPESFGALQQRLEELEQRTETSRQAMEAMSRRLQLLEASFDQAAKASPDVLPQDVGAELERRLTEADLQRKKLREEVATERMRLENLTTHVESLIQRQQHRADVMVALVGLARAIEQSGPFLDELDAFERASGKAASLLLRQVAGSGLPSWQTLASRFSHVASASLASESRAAPPENLLDRIQKIVEDLIVIRPAHEIRGDSPRARISQAEARLREGDHKAMLDTLDGLSFAMEPPLSDWVAEARLRVTVEAEINRLLAEKLGRSS